MPPISNPTSHPKLPYLPSTQDYQIHDPGLSELGRGQCRDLRKDIMGRIPKELDVGLIVVSPMIRTLETAMLAFEGLIDKGVPIVAHAGWQGTHRPLRTTSNTARH